MSNPDSLDDYWFDAGPLLAQQTKSSPLKKLKSLLPGGEESELNLLEDFARANGFGYDALLQVRDRKFPLPSLVIRDHCDSVLTQHDTPTLEFGNHGSPIWALESNEPTRRGYIAIQHDLELPHTYVTSNGPGTISVEIIAATAITIMGIFSADRSEFSGFTPVETFRCDSAKLEMLPTDCGFNAHAEPTRKGEAHTLLTGTALPLVSHLAGSFDLELRDKWLFAYGYFGDLSTLDPEVWAWALSIASRMFDLLNEWRTREYAGPERGWYTSEWIERPSKLDGALRTAIARRR